MGSLYYPWADIARDAGLVVKVTNANRGWERRARSTGGFSAAPLGVMWHHAASSRTTSDEACVSYQVRGNPANPVGNITLGRDGDVWPIAGGASNCSGKGGPWKFSRGTCARDSGNTTLVNIEVNNDGVGGPWSTQLIDSYFALSNAINAHLANQPGDVVTHHAYTPTRKIDPATAHAVQGAWKPRPCTTSGTWHLDDIRDECEHRTIAPAPIPQPPEEEDDDVNTPASVLLGPERLDNFVRGSDGQLWHNWWQPGYGWIDWQCLGGQLASAPSATVTYVGKADDGHDYYRIDVTAKGMDDQLWHLWWDDTQWIGWEQVAPWP